MALFNGQVTQSELGTSRAREVISKFHVYLIASRKGLLNGICPFLSQYLDEIHIVLSSNFEFIRRIVDLKF